jgi:hypothetical protein
MRAALGGSIPDAFGAIPTACGVHGPGSRAAEACTPRAHPL